MIDFRVLDARQRHIGLHNDHSDLHGMVLVLKFTICHVFITRRQNNAHGHLQPRMSLLFVPRLCDFLWQTACK